MKVEAFHPQKIQLLQIDALNRSSSIFFTFLLDSHNELINSYIYDYPGEWKTINEAAKNSYALLKKGWLTMVNKEKLPFSYQEFKAPFCLYLKEFGISTKNVFIAIHYAIAILQKREIKSIKYIVYYTHGELRNFIAARKDFDSKCILTVRDPRASIWSYKKGEGMPIQGTLFLAPVYLHIYSHYFQTKNILYIKHEDLHTQFPETKKRFCKFLRISNEKSLNTATVFGEEWTGNVKGGVLSHSKKTSSKPSPKFVNEEWKQNLGHKEIFLINIFNRTIIEKFKYKLDKGVSKTSKKCINYHLLLIRATIWMPAKIKEYIRAKYPNPTTFGPTARFILQCSSLIIPLRDIQNKYFLTFRYKLGK